MESPAFPPAEYPAPSLGKRTIGFLLNLLETLILAFLLYLGMNAVLGRVRIESISMEPTLFRDEMVMVDKLSLHFGCLQRGDVIVFHYPPDPTQQYIKRVVGLPGDQILIEDGRLTINGIRVREAYIADPASYEGAWRVPQKAVFVLGDNRNRSNDSHIWGTVPMTHVVGKAFFVYWPPEDAGVIPGLPKFHLP